MLVVHIIVLPTNEDKGVSMGEFHHVTNDYEFAFSLVDRVATASEVRSQAASRVGKEDADIYLCHSLGLCDKNGSSAYNEYELAALYFFRRFLMLASCSAA